MKAIDRLYEYLDNKGIKPTNFEKEIDFSNGYLSAMKKREADMGEAVLKKITDYCRDISPEWLLTGNGPMLRNGEPIRTSEPPTVYERDPRDIQLIATQEETIRRDKELVAAKDELITMLKDRIRDLEKQGFRTEISGGVPTADYPSPTGAQRHRK